MPLGDGQKNNLLNLTMDLWEGQVFFEGQAYPAGYFAASVMNRTAEENTALLVKAGQLLRDMDAFTHAGSGGERAAPEKIKPQLRSLLDDIWRIEPFSQMDEANERATVETIFADPFWAPVLQDGTRERRFFLRYAESLIRVSQAVINFDSVAWTLEAFYLHRLKRRSETFYVHAVMDCFRRPELWNEIQKHELLPVENFTLSPQLQAGTALMRHPAKDQTMVFASRLIFQRFIDFYIYDLLNGMHFGHAPFRCENCGRYYLSAAARLTRYCDGTAPQDARYTCRQYGALMRQKEKNRDHPVYALFKTRTNTIRKHHERGKISDALRAAAISQAETCRDKALFDSTYASAGYEADMELASLYEAAERRLGDG